jgi:energy-converting hydrogenase Eha subunit C
MANDLTGWFAVITLVITSIGLLLSREWRNLLIFLSVQYAGMFILVVQHWPLSMATIKVIAGWMCAAILSMTLANIKQIPSQNETSTTLPFGRMFRLLAAVIVCALAISAAPSIDSMLADAGLAVSAGGLVLIGMGLLHLGMTDDILRVTIGLLTVLCGFEILYSSVENSILVAAILVVINLGLALVGSYLIIASHFEETESA